MSSAASRPLRLCVAQLDVIPQAREHNLWTPAEPRLPKLVSDHPTDPHAFSVAGLFATADAPDVYQAVQRMVVDAVTTRLTEVLQFVARYEADVVVFPEYAVPVGCLHVLLEHSPSRAIVARPGPDP